METKKSKKSRTVPKKLKEGPFSLVRFCMSCKKNKKKNKKRVIVLAGLFYSKSAD